jgi:hypothetical protein
VAQIPLPSLLSNSLHTEYVRRFKYSISVGSSLPPISYMDHKPHCNDSTTEYLSVWHRGLGARVRCGTSG